VISSKLFKYVKNSAYLCSAFICILLNKKKWRQTIRHMLSWKADTFQSGK
jgi:hypothetical protein